MVCTGLCRGAFKFFQLRVFGFFTPAADLISTATRGLSQKMGLNRTIHYLILFNPLFVCLLPSLDVSVCVCHFTFADIGSGMKLQRYENNIYTGTQATSLR